ncbi:hypothetical protein MP228_007531 [Amoeboaphelidium protococcarum]|nr:hypothetical protein MP228_007531 [Amoeboaphelidium protococcarum]
MAESSNSNMNIENVESMDAGAQQLQATPAQQQQQQSSSSTNEFCEGFLYKRSGPLKLWHKKYVYFGNDHGLSVEDLDLVVKKALSKSRKVKGTSDVLMKIAAKAMVSTKGMILYDSSDHNSIAGIIDLSMVKDIVLADFGNLHAFTLKVDGLKDVTFGAKSAEGRDMWINVIQKHSKANCVDAASIDNALVKLKAHFESLKPGKLKKEPSHADATDTDGEELVTEMENIDADRAQVDVIESVTGESAVVTEEAAKTTADKDDVEETAGDSKQPKRLLGKVVDIFTLPRRKSEVGDKDVVEDVSDNTGSASEDGKKEELPAIVVEEVVAEEVQPIDGAMQSEPIVDDPVIEKALPVKKPFMVSRIVDIVTFKKMRSKTSADAQDAPVEADLIAEDLAPVEPEPIVEADVAASDEVTMKDEIHDPNPIPVEKDIPAVDESAETTQPAVSDDSQMYKVPEATIQQSLLKKQSNFFKAWNDRYFALSKVGDDGFMLSYFRPNDKSKVAESFMLSSDMKVKADGELKFTLNDGKKSYYLMALNEHDLNEWISVLNGLYPKSDESA